MRRLSSRCLGSLRSEGSFSLNHSAKDVFPGEDAIGKRVRVNGEEWEVVGVFAKYDSLFGGLFENFAVRGAKA